MKKHKIHLNGLAMAMVLAALSHGTMQAQVPLNEDWRVQGVDTTKPGFIWNYFSSPPNRGNSTDRTESDLAGQSRDATGALLPNLGDPNTVGAAIAAAAPANPANGLLRFEIAGVINLNKTEGGGNGNFTPDELEPGLNPLESTDGQAAEILTYLDLPVGIITMGVNSDDGFQTAAGANPRDAFGKLVLGEYNGGRGASDTTFQFEVTKAGMYPFRTIWENGGGDSNIEWFTVQADGVTKVLINDVTNGGIPAYRAVSAAAVVAPYVKTVSPAALPRQVEGSSPSVTVVLADGSNPVADNSVTLSVDGQPATLTRTRQGNTLTVDTGVLPGLHLAGEAHTGLLTYSDSTGTNTYSTQWTFYNLENLILPATPVTGENFDAYPEATSAATTVPPGWVAWNYTYRETEGWDLTTVNSDAYLDFVMISTTTVQGIAGETLQNNQAQTINGIPLTNPDNWMSNNLLHVASDGRARNIPDPDGGPNISVGQINFVITAPFNLSTVANPVVTFSSGARLSGNKEQMTMEYSIDRGTNWLPVIYMRNSSTIRIRSDGAYDAVLMCTEMDTNAIARWPTPGVGPNGGNFGDMIAAPISQGLAPYFVNRNDSVAARKVEAIRIPNASRQSDVRLRLTHAGSCGWDWGVDNIAFYDIAPPTVAAPNVTSAVVSAGSITIQWANGGTLESSTTIGGSPVWTTTGNSSGTFTEAVSAPGNKFYRVRR